MVYDKESLCQPKPSPWGLEVKSRLAKRGLRQNDLVDLLRERGCNIDKTSLSHLLKGIGVPSRTKEIKEINDFLNIPFKY